MDVSWTIKKTEHQRIDAFELWCWRRRLSVPWTERRSNQSILREISSEYSLEGLMLKLKLNTLATGYEKLTHWKKPWCWEWLKVGREGDDRGWDGWMASLTWWTWVWASSRSWWWIGRPGILQSMRSQSWTQLSDWTDLNWMIRKLFLSRMQIIRILCFVGNVTFLSLILFHLLLFSPLFPFIFFILSSLIINILSLRNE